MHIRVIDSGASRLKAVGSDKRGKPLFLSMSPYCAKVEFAECERLRSLWGDDVSIESSWVSDLERCYFLGEGAKKHHGSELGNDELKYEKAIYKTLGVIGHFAKTLDIENGERIYVGVLLPINEYATKEKFVSRFSRAIQQFSYCGRELNFELADLVVRPEGCGTYLKGLPRNVPSKLLRIASLVIGHRNASWSVNDRGYPSLSESKTCDLGYRWLVDEIKAQTGHKDELWITRQIFSKGDREVCAIAEALLPSYWRQIHGWISQQAPVDYVVVSGGTGFLLRPQIEQGLANAIWPDDLLNEVLKYEPDKAMAGRFVDAFGIYKSIDSKLRAKT